MDSKKYVQIMSEGHVEVKNISRNFEDRLLVVSENIPRKPGAFATANSAPKRIFLPRKVLEKAALKKNVQMGEQSKKEIVVADKYFYPLKKDELRLMKGRQIVVLEKADGGWWKGSSNGQVGWFPSDYVAAATPENLKVSAFVARTFFEFLYVLK